MSTRIRALSALVADRFGYRQAGADWAERLPHLEGRFRRSALQSSRRVLLATFGFVAVIAGTAREMARPGMGDLFDPFLLVLACLLVVCSALVLRPLGRSYEFNNGELRCVSWRGRVLWREDLRGLEYVTCTRGGGWTQMTLKWPDRRRRIELFDSLEKALGTP